MSIALSNFGPLEIYKNFDLPLSAINFSVKIYADNYFYKNIYLFNLIVLYEMSFFNVLNYMLRFFIFIFDFNMSQSCYFSK